MGKKYKKNFAITIFNTITVMCIEQIPADMLMMWGKQDIDRFIGNPSQASMPKISSNLTLDISKPVYERNENISLLVQWTGADVDCKILEEKVKETLVMLLPKLMLASVPKLTLNKNISKQLLKMLMTK